MLKKYEILGVHSFLNAVVINFSTQLGYKSQGSDRCVILSALFSRIKLGEINPNQCYPDAFTFLKRNFSSLKCY